MSTKMKNPPASGAIARGVIEEMGVTISRAEIEGRPRHFNSDCRLYFARILDGFAGTVLSAGMLAAAYVRMLHPNMEMSRWLVQADSVAPGPLSKIISRVARMHLPQEPGMAFCNRHLALVGNSLVKHRH